MATPAPTVKLKAARTRDRRTPTWGELSTVLEGAPDDVRAALVIQASTGARLGEIAHLQRDDVDLGAGLLHLGRHEGARKTGARTVPLVGDARRVVEALIEQPVKRRSTPDGVTLLGVPVTTRARVLDYLRSWPWTEHGIKRFTSHGIRRLVIDTMARSQVDVATTAAYVGHSPMQMLTIYRQVTAEDRAAAARAAGLGGRLGGATPAVPLERAGTTARHTPRRAASRRG